MHQPTCQPLDRTFFDGHTRLDGHTTAVAQRLLGKLLVRRLDNGERLSGIIVEVEAYLSEDDPACHSHRGPTLRNASMFLSAGTLYVYSIHTRYCLNVVTEAAGRGSAVLIRALQPWEGLEPMAALRGLKAPVAVPGEPVIPHQTAWLRSLTTGPGRLCQALAVDRAHDGLELSRSDTIWLEAAPNCVSETTWKIGSSPRIGISRAQTLPLRWFIDGHQSVSGCARDHSRRRHWRFATS